MSVAALEKKVKEAKAAHKANKEDASLKKAYKAAKKAHEEAVAAEAAKAEASKKRKASSDDSSEEETPAPAKKQKVVTLEDLQAAAKAAKAAHKANKDDASLKAAYKAAKKAVEEFSGGAAVEEEPQEEAPAPVLKKANPAASPLAPKKVAGGDADGGEPNQKLFIGNLAWTIDDDAVKAFFADCGGAITDIFWLEDKDSGKFKGCGFITFDSLEAAQKAHAKRGQDLMGRDITIDYAKARPGGDQPKREPKKSPFAGKGLSERPEGCTTVFCGNLSFDIDDEKMIEFAKDCGEVKQVRWLTDKNTGDFKGCGFVEFYDSEAVDKFVKKNGEQLLGREIRVDYSGAKAGR